MYVRRFHEFSEWGQCMLLEILLRYQPENDEELFDIMVRSSNSNLKLSSS